MSTDSSRKAAGNSRVALALALLAVLAVISVAFTARSSGGRGRALGADGASYDTVTVPAIWVPIGTKEAREGAGEPKWRVTLCLVEWDEYWRRPHDFGKFKQVQSASRCGDSRNTRVLDLAEAAAEARARSPAPLEPSGFVFQESRVGSTLVANMLAAVPSHLVYSEGIRLPRSPRATDDQARRAIRDYVALLGAPATANGSPASSHGRLFIKFQSAASAADTMPLVLGAFPDTPWLFVHREPVEVMMSHGASGFGRAVCTARIKSPPDAVCDILGPADCRKPTPERYCAAHLAHLCDGAILSAEADRGRCGRILAYDTNIADTMVDDVFPNLFGVDVDPAARAAMRATAAQYSKSAEGKHGGKDGKFAGDTDRKRDAATPAAREAVDRYLADRYARLSALTVADQGACPRAPPRAVAAPGAGHYSD